LDVGDIADDFKHGYRSLKPPMRCSASVKGIEACVNEDADGSVAGCGGALPSPLVSHATTASATLDVIRCAVLLRPYARLEPPRRGDMIARDGGRDGSKPILASR
jgi:hypothetical protein